MGYLDTYSLTWLPGGKTLSFIYKETLYTIPAH